MPSEEAVLKITLAGDRSDLEYLRTRAEGAVSAIVDDESSHLDHPVEVDWDWEEA